MRILYYNWVDPHDPQGRGGGVSQYQRRLLDHLEPMPDVTAVFLSSGLARDLRSSEPRVEAIDRAPSGNRYEIVNSACLSPSHHSFGHPAQLSDPATEAAFATFLSEQDPFDVIHFNNLEGVPAAVLDLKSSHPETRFILSLHNYYPFCPQVNLWHRERALCSDFQNGASCVGCLPFTPSDRLVRLAHATNYTLRKTGIGPGTRVHEHLAAPAMRTAAKTFRRLASASRATNATAEPASPSPQQARVFRDRRARMVELINRNCDGVLCVSDRVAELAIGYGIDRSRVATSYIGSDHADLYATTQPRKTLLRPGGTSHMAYLGYMRRDKGFYFLLDALETLSSEHSARLHLTLAAAGRDPDAMSAIDRLRPRFASLNWVDGYARNEMDALLGDVDFGIVPSLWEDNLPQVAIEMHARHIPLLTSDRGGARELGRSPEMVFRAGDGSDLHARLSDILDGKIDLNAYWSRAMAPVTMTHHLQDLFDHYRSPNRKAVQD